MDKKISELDPISIISTTDEIAISDGETKKVSVEQLDERYLHADEFTEINSELANQPKDSFISGLLDANRRVYNYLVKGNTTNVQSTDHFYFIDGNPDTSYWKARLAAVFRLPSFAQQIIHDYGAYGQITPTDAGNMKLASTPSGVNITYDNGSGGGTNFHYNVAPNDIIVNDTRTQTAIVASWNYSLKAGTVTNAADISTWADNDDVRIINGQVSGLFHFHTGFTKVYDNNATSKLTMRSSSSANKLRFQSQDREVRFYGKKGPSQGNFDIYDVTDSDVGTLVTANVDCSNGTDTYGNLLYTWVTADADGIYTENDYKFRIFEIRPLSSSPVDIEFVRTYTTRAQAAANSCSSQEYMLHMAAVAVAQRDQTMIDNVIKGIKNLIYNNQLYATGTANRPWSDYYYLGDATRFDFPANGVSAFTETTYSSNQVYAVYRNQPTDTRTGFVTSGLGGAYGVLKPYLSVGDKTIFQDSIIGAARHLKTLSSAFDVYTANAAIWFYISFLHRHQVALDLAEVPATFVLNGAINAVVTSMIFDDVTEIEVGDVILMGAEKIGITSINLVTNTVNVVRAIGGTTAASHLDNATATALNWKELASVMCYHMVNGNPGTTNAQWFKYMTGSGLNEETDIAFGVELPQSTTTNGSLLAAATSAVVTSATALGLTSGGVRINKPWDVQARKSDNTYEFMKVYYSTSNTLSVERAQYGSTAEATLVTSSLIGRLNDWSYGRLIPSLLGWAYFLAKKYSSPEADAIRKMAKATQRMLEKRINLDNGRFESYGGSRLSEGGAVIGESGALYNILHAMGEGIDYPKMEKYQVYAKAEIEQYGYIADAERETGSDNANRELGAPIIGMTYSVPIQIKLINANINE